MAPPPWNPEASLVSPRRSPSCALPIRQWLKGDAKARLGDCARHTPHRHGAPCAILNTAANNSLFLHLVWLQVQIQLLTRSGSSNEWASSYGSKSHQQQEVADLCGKLSPIIERLALLNEGKVGHNLKVFKRLANTVKEMAVQKCL
ncbi:hypothetical protein F2Q70_00031228 [Brassica cretica]|uniref:Uncharacterized protein n=1 Tax=Brassica cretica TaxID=69181 RepID=A0A8S9FC70_BRACR|nr:hypothetical protein F2Q70_00031228 [Brassica cretica]